MDDNATRRCCADCIAAAAKAGWYALAVGVGLLLLTGVFYIGATHLYGMRLIGAIWGVPASTAQWLTLVFLAGLKFVLIIWLLITLCLHWWARELRKGAAD